MMDCKFSKRLEYCPCTLAGCPNKGICCDCIHHHLIKKELPACYFSTEGELSYDRSIDNFIYDYKKRVLDKGGVND